MAYNGTIELISGITPKNGQDFPLAQAKDIYVDDDLRLDQALKNISTDASNIATIFKNKEEYDTAKTEGIILKDTLCIIKGC